jgi:hypothetical protein
MILMIMMIIIIMIIIVIILIEKYITFDSHRDDVDEVSLPSSHMHVSFVSHCVISTILLHTTELYL